MSICKYSCTEERFLKDAAAHQMEVLRAPAPRDAQEFCADSFRQHVQEAFDSLKSSGMRCGQR